MKSIIINKEYEQPVIDHKYWKKIYKAGRPTSLNSHGDPNINKDITCNNCLQRKDCGYA